jgi:hypothetical protein
VITGKRGRACVNTSAPRVKLRGGKCALPKVAVGGGREREGAGRGWRGGRSFAEVVSGERGRERGRERERERQRLRQLDTTKVCGRSGSVCGWVWVGVGGWVGG